MILLKDRLKKIDIAMRWLLGKIVILRATPSTQARIAWRTAGHTTESPFLLQAPAGQPERAASHCFSSRYSLTGVSSIRSHLMEHFPCTACCALYPTLYL